MAGAAVVVKWKRAGNLPQAQGRQAGIRICSMCAGRQAGVAGMAWWHGAGRQACAGSRQSSSAGSARSGGSVVQQAGAEPGGGAAMLN